MQVLALLRRIQLSGAVGMRVVRGANDQEASILTLRSADVPAATLADATLLAAASDMVLLVIRHAHTDRDLVAKTVQRCAASIRTWRGRC